MPPRVTICRLFNLLPMQGFSILPFAPILAAHTSEHLPTLTFERKIRTCIKWRININQINFPGELFQNETPSPTGCRPKSACFSSRLRRCPLRFPRRCRKGFSGCRLSGLRALRVARLSLTVSMTWKGRLTRGTSIEGAVFDVLSGPDQLDARNPHPSCWWVREPYRRFDHLHFSLGLFPTKALARPCFGASFSPWFSFRSSLKFSLTQPFYAVFP